MKNITNILILFILFILIFTGCNINTAENSPVDQVNEKQSLELHEIKAIQTTFPVYLSKLDFDTTKQTTVSQIVNEKIKQIILDHYFQDCNGDSSETYLSVKDILFNTVQVSDSSLTAYFIIFNPFAVCGGLVNSRILLYNNKSKSFNSEVIDFNMHALYDIENDKLIPSNLKVHFEINSPEIELSDFNNDGIPELKLTRLHHNGTSNSIETTILIIDSNNLDTLDFREDWK